MKSRLAVLLFSVLFFQTASAAVIPCSQTVRFGFSDTLMHGGRTATPVQASTRHKHQTKLFQNPIYKKLLKFRRQKERKSLWSVIALVAGAAALPLLYLSPFFALFSLAAVVFGSMALRAKEKTTRVQALIGFILGLVPFVAIAVLLILLSGHGIE